MLRGRLGTQIEPVWAQEEVGEIFKGLKMTRGTTKAKKHKVAAFEFKAALVFWH